MINKTIIELSDTDADMFILFQQNYENISKLLQYNVFEERSKTLILHIDGCGKINGMEIKIKVK
jgi:hypothetical protein